MKNSTAIENAIISGKNLGTEISQPTNVFQNTLKESLTNMLYKLFQKTEKNKV